MSKLTTSSNLYCIFLIKDVRMYLGQWDVSLDPIKQAVLTEKHILQSNIVNNCSGGGSSSTGMAAVVIAIAHKHTFR